MKKFARRIAVVAAVAAVGAMSLSGTAAAHVSLSESEAEAGAHARIDFRVPNESDEASTVKIEVTLPEDYPMVSVSTKAVPGWDVKTDKRTLDEPVTAYDREFDEVVSTITWTADSDKDGIAPGQFGEFPVSLGPIPEKVGATLVFKVLQTYSDGEESPWIEAPQKGKEEPEHPAPVLTVVPAADADLTSGTDTGTTDTAATEPKTDKTGIILGGIGAALGAIALVVALLALRKRPAAATE